MDESDAPFLVLSASEAAIAGAVFERMFPADVHGPGAQEIGAVMYLDRALAGAYAHLIPDYRSGLAMLDSASRLRHDHGFAELDAHEQDAMLRDLELGTIPGWMVPEQRPFFELLRAHLQEGLFGDPLYGGNLDKLGWRVLGHPGVWLENSAEENLSPEPVTKAGRLQSLADVAGALRHHFPESAIPGFDPQRGAAPPAKHADVVMIGVGGAGGFIAPMLAKAGLNVVGLEAGPWWQRDEFQPDELRA
ncbi:MAG: gluconate 2-dehydrogenase subunit 3 family protein, partial [Chloroflexia bacterium]|nr:gluconate 2-dehydrogenase subunit 3 family protein [Chloroflexia bacterium]